VDSGIDPRSLWTQSPAARHHCDVASYDVDHADARRLARRAAVRSGSEHDPVLRARAREMSVSERLRIGFELSRQASRLRVKDA
jgi:hypothetical protein